MRIILILFAIGASLVMLPVVLLAIFVFPPIGVILLLIGIFLFVANCGGDVIYSKRDIENERLKFQEFLTSSRGRL